MTKRVSLVSQLRGLGFDDSHVDLFTRGATVACSQCEALVINGHPCHEKGCPNELRRLEDAVRAAEEAVEDGQARWSETGSTRKR